MKVKVGAEITVMRATTIVQATVVQQELSVRGTALIVYRIKKVLWRSSARRFGGDDVPTQIGWVGENTAEWLPGWSDEACEALRAVSAL